ncbi:hypothetical protein CH063_05329, partial [Colletotrichum higginsianum]
TYLPRLHPFSWATVFSLLRRCPQTQRLLSRIEVSYSGNPFWTPLLARQLVMIWNMFWNLFWHP